MKITSRRMLAGFALLMLIGSSCALADENASVGAKFFVTFPLSQMAKGAPTPSPAQIETARTAKESRPAAADPEGHWGASAEGFQLSVRFEKESFHVGEPVIAVVIIRNVAERNAYYRDFVGLHEDAPVCQFEVLDEQQKPVARLDARAAIDIKDGPHIPRGLKPGTQCRYEIKLQDKFKLNQAGKYTIRARRWVHKMIGDGYAQVVSGAATITISGGEKQRSDHESIRTF